MGNLCKIFVVVLCWLSNTQIASACHGISPLTQFDVAFAEVVFEGHIRAVRPDLSDKSSELVFDIHNVIRGDVPQKQMTVLLQGGVAYSAPASLEDFVKRYGENTRIALTTPRQVKLFCETNEETSSSRCDYSVLRDTPKTKIMPAVYRKPCGQPYIFDVGLYQKMKNYHANLEVYDSLPRHVQGLEAYKKITGGVGPLPWDLP